MKCRRSKCLGHLERVAVGQAVEAREAVVELVRWLLVLRIGHAASPGELRSPAEVVCEMVAVQQQQLKWRRCSKAINSPCDCGSFQYRQTSGSDPPKKMRAGRNRLARTITA